MQFNKPNKPIIDSPYRINFQIRIPEIRLVGDNLEELSTLTGVSIEPGIYPTRKVLGWAEEAGLDLVEISPNATPPVCRITDYNKFLYSKKKKEKEIKANAAKTVIKEIRFGPNTDDHDFQFKVRHAIKFLEEGSKVKSYVFFCGSAIVFKDRGHDLLARFIEELKDYAVVESEPKLEGKKMIVVLNPRKEILKKKK